MFFINLPKKKGFVWFTWIWMKTRSTHTWVDVSLWSQFRSLRFPHFNANCWRNEVTEHIILTTFWIWPIAFLFLCQLTCSHILFFLKKPSSYYSQGLITFQVNYSDKYLLGTAVGSVWQRVQKFSKYAAGCLTTSALTGWHHETRQPFIWGFSSHWWLLPKTPPFIRPCTLVIS